MRQRRPTHRQWWYRALGVLTVLLLASTARAQQDTGHQYPGALGLNAGTQPDQGLYVTNQLVWYSADGIRNGSGNPIPLNIHSSALVNVVGVGGIVLLPALHTYYGVTLAIPIARVRVQSDRPELGFDRFGFSDIYASPMGLGWRRSHFDVVVAYGIYAPTGRFEPGGRGSLGRGSWTNQFDLGGAVYLDESHTWYGSMLASYQLNGRKNGIDITRGDTIQIQGGIGTTVLKLVDLGVVGFADWQVTDNTGSALPKVLRTTHDQSYALGAEAGVTLPWIRAQLTFRYMHELGVHVGPQGQVLVGNLTFKAL